MSDNEITDPASVHLSAKEIANYIPQELFDRLLAIRNDLDNLSWELGDRTNEIVNLFYNAGYTAIQKQDIYAAVGRVVGKAARTIRLYAKVAMEFTPDIRQHYEQLPFSHFVFASGFSDLVDTKNVPYSIHLLEKSMDYFEQWGITPSVEMLDGIFKKELQPTLPPTGPTVLENPITPEERYTKFLAGVILDPNLPPEQEIQDAYKGVSNIIDHLVKVLDRIADLEATLQIEKPITRELSRAISYINQLQEKIDERTGDYRAIYRNDQY